MEKDSHVLTNGKDILRLRDILVFSNFFLNIFFLNTCWKYEWTITSRVEHKQNIVWRVNAEGHRLLDIAI